MIDIQPLLKKLRELGNKQVEMDNMDKAIGIMMAITEIEKYFKPD